MEKDYKKQFKDIWMNAKKNTKKFTKNYSIRQTSTTYDNAIVIYSEWKIEILYFGIC